MGRGSTQLGENIFGQSHSNKAGYKANKQSLVGGQGQYTQGQGQSISGQGLNFWVGRGCYAQKSQILL